MPAHADGVTAVVDLTDFGVRHMDLAVVRLRRQPHPYQYKDAHARPYRHPHMSATMMAGATHTGSCFG
jgi:hypothetical protein